MEETGSYDPGTGRFLNRSARPQQTNPYVPCPQEGAARSGDPAGMFVAPLSLLGLLLGKKKKRGKWELVAVILVLGLSLGMSLTACTKNIGETKIEVTPVTPTPDSTESTALAVTVTSPTMTATFTLTPTNSPSSSCSDLDNNSNEAILETIQKLENYILSEGSKIKALSDYANRENVRLYLRRLMDEVGNYEEKLNTNHLAYIYATTHIESAWGDFTERYEYNTDPEDYFDDLYGPDTLTGKTLGNILKGDGYRYMGRGFVHLTGRSNYRKIGEVLGLGTSLEDYPERAQYGLSISRDYDYVTKIAVTGMAKGVFTGEKLTDYDNEDGTYQFVEARSIINWPGAQDGNPAILAGSLGSAYAEILDEACQQGGVSNGIQCASCR